MTCSLVRRSLGFDPFAAFVAFWVGFGAFAVRAFSDGRPMASNAVPRSCGLVRTPSNRSPTLAKRFHTVSMVKSCGETPFWTSFHVSGVETVAAVSGRREYAAEMLAPARLVLYSLQTRRAPVLAGPAIVTGSRSGRA